MQVYPNAHFAVLLPRQKSSVACGPADGSPPTPSRPFALGGSRPRWRGCAVASRSLALRAASAIRRPRLMAPAPLRRARLRPLPRLVSALDLEADGFVQKTKDETGQCFYLCENEHGDRMPIRATEWKSAKAAGWQKLYNFEDGQRRTMKQAKAEGLGTKDRTSKRPVQMHRREGQSAYAVGREEMDEVREAWAKIANRHLAAAAAAALSVSARHMDAALGTARGGACMRGQAPSNSPLSRLFVTRHTSRIYSVVVAEYIRAPI